MAAGSTKGRKLRNINTPLPICPNPPHRWVVSASNYGVCRSGCEYQFPRMDDVFSPREANEIVFFKDASRVYGRPYGVD